MEDVYCLLQNTFAVTCIFISLIKTIQNFKSNYNLIINVSVKINRYVKIKKKIFRAAFQNIMFTDIRIVKENVHNNYLIIILYTNTRKI